LALPAGTPRPFRADRSEEGIHFQDCFAILPEKATMANSAYLFADSIHLSRTGHELVGRMVADAVAALASAKGWVGSLWEGWRMRAKPRSLMWMGLSFKG